MTILERFCADLLPPAAGGPDPSVLAVDVDRYVRRLPPPTRLGVRLGLAAATLGAPMPSDAREALKALVLLVHGGTSFAPDTLARSNVEPPARPDAALTVVPSSEWPSVSRVDVAVVGSGAGGAMTARTLARAGFDTVVVEEGRRFAVDEFRTRPPMDRFADLYRDAGTTIVLGDPPVVMPVGRGVGGTTLVNSGTCYRTPESVLRAWRDHLGVTAADPASFARHLDEVEATIRVAPVPLDTMGRNGQLMLAGAERLGWRAQPLRRNAPGCGGCCQCAIGCPRNAKFGVHLNALPQACAAGARIVSEARVTRLLHERGRVTGLLMRRPDGSGVRIEAETVVVAAGATETPGLLRRSGLGRHRQVGRNLALHPAVAAAGRFEERVVPWRGVLQSAAIEEFHESHRILVEATSTPPGMGSLALPGWGDALLGELERAEHNVTLGAMIGDGPWGRVLGRRSGQTVLGYRLPAEALGRLRFAVRVMAEALFAAGATEVLAGVPGIPGVRSLAELDAAMDGVSTRRLHLAAFHPTGTARAGADAQRCPVDEWGRLRGISGVWVTDASAVPTCPDVNPQVSIMALALAFADRLATERGGGPVGG